MAAMDNDVSRRSVLMGAGGLLMAGAQGALPVLPADSSAPGTLDLASPAANLAGFIRMMASMTDEDVPWWYNGTVYAVRGESQNPQALFHFEGMVLYSVVHLADGTFGRRGFVTWPLLFPEHHLQLLSVESHLIPLDSHCLYHL